MKVSIIGAGYVGITLLSVLIKKGIEVIINDIDQHKIDVLKKGESNISEKGIDELLRTYKNNYDATLDLKKTILDTQISFISINTPSDFDGKVNLTYLFKLIEDISSILEEKKDYHLFVIRSTIPVGTSKKIIKILEQKTSKKIGFDFGLCMNPEFLREGKMIEDFLNPSFIIVGQSDVKSGNLLKLFYNKIGFHNNLFVMTLEEAEIFKYINNAFHALKVGFVNEIMRVSKNFNINSKKLMEIFIKDKKQNISSYYLRPGFAFGGSCLPKDLKGLVFDIGQNMNLPILKNILISNKEHINFYFNEIIKKNPSKILFSGISFKEGTADLRESPYLHLFKKLIQKKISVDIIDLNVLSSLFGTNTHLFQKFDLKSFLINSIQDINAYDMILLGSYNHIPLKLLKKFKGCLFDLNNSFSDLSKITQNYISF